MDVMMLMLLMAAAGEKWGFEKIAYLAYGTVSTIFIGFMGTIVYAATML